MKRDFTRYRRVGQRFVPGFLQGDVLTILEAIDREQRRREIGGAVAEIGVHHGKLFIGMHLLQSPGERSVAVDIFGDQQLNVDKSGRGDREKFLANVELWSSPDGVRVHQGDSTELTPAQLEELAGGRLRLFSVDGGHTEDVVLSDMRLADQTVIDGGVVVADDVYNEHWPGVAVGTVRFLASRPRLVPFLVGFNKVFFTTPEHSEAYRRAVLDEMVDWRVKSWPSHLGGHPVDVLATQTAVNALRGSATARRVYHFTYGGLTGALRTSAGRASRT